MNLSDVTNLLGITNTKEQEAEPPKKPAFDIEKEGDRKVLFSWTAPSRVQKQTGPSQKRLRTLIVIAVVIVLLLAIMQEFALILVIASIIFINHVLSATPPEEVKCELTNHGVEYAGQFYYWNELKHFFFTQDDNGDVLNIDVKNKLPARLFLTVKSGNKGKVGSILGTYLPLLEKKPEDFMDRAYNSVINKFDLKDK